MTEHVMYDTKLPGNVNGSYVNGAVVCAARAVNARKPQKHGRNRFSSPFCSRSPSLNNNI